MRTIAESSLSESYYTFLALENGVEVPSILVEQSGISDSTEPDEGVPRSEYRRIK